MAAKSRSPLEFLDGLRDGSLATQVEIYGMVDKSEDGNDDEIRFSQDCTSWIPIPIAMIEEIEPLGTSPCKDHAHHIARISFGEPQSDEAKVLARLVADMQRAPQSERRNSLSEILMDESCRQCIRDCHKRHYGDFFAFIECCRTKCERC
ncbi:hypothetical protein [Nonomuraea aridisoli]|uniref:hypothetical protein n=1 Tax=Nonomuraea aridisoli TaxID=2070368 RepID=UPI0011B9442B|nr:hypothetical protein [Nonomuraea aridisoli]